MNIKHSVNIPFDWIKNGLSTGLESHPAGGAQEQATLRSTLFSTEQMEAHGVELAANHTLRQKSGPDQLLARLDDNQRVLTQCCKMLTSVTESANEQRLSPAGEWLLDNYYLVEEHIHIAKKHLPKSYIRELPQLAEGPAAGLPRVYDIAIENISHGDGRLDARVLSRFVYAYQTVSPLKLGELWAIPGMLRLALIENIRRVAARLMASWHDQNLAIAWADRLLETASKDRKNLLVTVAEMAASKPPLTNAFVAELSRRLQGQGAAVAMPLTWVEEMLAESGLGIDVLVHNDTQEHAADQVTISNSITSLRMLASQDWRSFVESLSIVEQLLRSDPSGVYETMDFATRDSYRHVIERLARQSGLEEREITRLSVELARECGGYARGELAGAATDDAAPPESHVGYYLVDKGLPLLKNRICTSAKSPKRALWRMGLKRAPGDTPLSLYLGATAVLTLLFAWPLLTLLRQFEHEAVPALLVAVIILAMSQTGLMLANWLACKVSVPFHTPRLDFRKGIPGTHRTLVIVPTMFGNPDDVDQMLEKLEVHYLANADPNLQFGLLSDFKDAKHETMPGDEAVLERARSGILALNTRYPGNGVDHFFLCHRPRTWNQQEQMWMGRERKRGKISDFNALIRGNGRERFTLIVGNTLAVQPAHAAQSSPVRFVITLDSDTLLPMGVARELAGAMAHPLNRPVYDTTQKKIVSGHGILQPRIGTTLPSTHASTYAFLSAADAGIDPYTRAVSDVYEDLFRQGSFIGKGIYSVDAFEQALADRFPDNRILSHDLIEGAYARSGLISDVLLYEDYPAKYSSDVARRHRWIRGDWQLLPWLLPHVPLRFEREHNPLNALSRWKIFDNLRRSLVPAALFVSLTAGWMYAQSTLQALAWTLALMLTVCFVPLLNAVVHLLSGPREVSIRRHLSGTGSSLLHELAGIGLSFVNLPHEVWYSLDAIVRTLWRMSVSKRHLLQWNPSSDTERTSASTLSNYFRLMWPAPAAALILLVLLPVSSLPVAGLILLLWGMSPAIAWTLSQKRAKKTFMPTLEQQRQLRTLARKTWGYFEEHVNEEEHWLPPDNLQEVPVSVVASRTSPTNMGMALLADLSAYDFGYLSGPGLIDRLGHTLDSMHGLERFRTHFYNWYDTRTLAPLEPLYVSAVDSGNLAGHLLTLKNGLQNIPSAPVFDLKLLHGIRDTAYVLGDALLADNTDCPEWQVFKKDLEAAIRNTPRSLANACSATSRLAELARELADSCLPSEGSDAQHWLGKLYGQCLALRDFLESMPLDDALLFRLGFTGIPTWEALAEMDVSSLAGEEQQRAIAVREQAASFVHECQRLALLCESLSDMDFTFLYDEKQDMLSIGYSVNEQRLDASYYDLLASEARLTYYVGIARNQLPPKSWFTLSRLIAGGDKTPTLLSWSGSMFEYLMPELVMPGYEGTLLHASCVHAVTRQIEYGRDRKIPWGISESGYNALDSGFNYQYKAFGVPGLGLKRGLGEDTVIAPYASVMALMFAPDEAYRNVRKLSAMGLGGRYGLYEAVDYTPFRVPRGKESVIIRSFMAHHQGMSLLALASVLLEQPMQRRFMEEPRFQAAQLLLEERMPKAVPEYMHTCSNLSLNADEVTRRATESKLRVYTRPDQGPPAVQLLSNGRYHVMISNSGGGYSRHKESAVTRWNEDPTRDHCGMFFYLRDVASGEYWSAAHQPVRRQTELYEAVFRDARAEFKVRHLEYDSHMEIVVSPEDDIELRRLKIVNRAKETRTIEITSYAEVVLAPQAADTQHPAFSKLFVETEIDAPLQALVCSRRPRSDEEVRPYMFHLLAVHDADAETISYETDRARFIGRGRTTANPTVLEENGSWNLSGTNGAVLDPVVAIRCRITLGPGQSGTLDFVTGAGEDRTDCTRLMHKFRDRHLADRIFELAWTHSQMMLHQFNMSLFEAQTYEQLAASVIYTNPAMRAESGILQANHLGQTGLWGQAISGDLPIVLLRIGDSRNIKLVAQLVKAHAYWRMKGLKVDLVICNEDQASYRQNLQEMITSLIPSGTDSHVLDKAGGIYVRPTQQMSREDRILLFASARVVLSDTNGSFSEQVARRRAEPALPKACPLVALPARTGPTTTEEPREERILHNGYGGFSPDGTEYVIDLAPGQNVPAPWVNVLANPNFGSIVSESGNAYTWKENAYGYRLTPWGNDPVTDAGGEAFYLRDEATGHLWSPTPLPIRGDGSYTIRHGFGYSIFRHNEHGITSELTVFVAKDDPVKFSLLKVTNTTSQPRVLSATGYVEWVLGDVRSRTAMHIITGREPAAGSLYARTSYTTDFPGRVAFFDADATNRSATCDRMEFIGRNGSLRDPAGMRRVRLSGRAGAGYDPCGAIQTVFELDPGQTFETVFVLGASDSKEMATRLARHVTDVNTARDELEKVRRYWRDVLGKLQVETPDPAVNVMANGWLLYQNLASRYMARSGYYQSGGAIGFRDQLQDSMAVIHALPEISRAHLLLCAAHQFVEGDVQHWWHPPLDRGVRTTCSDDFLWLPLAVCRYVGVTGDTGVLDEAVTYLEARELNPGEESFYDLPMHSRLNETLYQHCVRAIERGMRRGEHGLPLIGGGDWNDGMSLVGEHGKGESVWLGFFQYHVLEQFIPLAEKRGDMTFAHNCRTYADELRESLETHGWDGQWYRRAYFDDGTPLGSSGNVECRIDSISQSWAVLSGSAPDWRQHKAMESLDAHLVRRDLGLIQLLTPAFDTMHPSPGYIKGYVPGVRENGGQYTHAAIWAVMAFARLGETEKAWELLNLINPVRHGDTQEAVDIYKVEPYVVSADVYTVATHAGRGGWSWYTGAAGWMYRLIIESLLGLRVENMALVLNPLLPGGWKGWTMRYNHHGTEYLIRVKRAKEQALLVDGEPHDGPIPLTAQGKRRTVEIHVPGPVAPRKSTRKTG